MPNALALARALRPFRQRWQSARELELDEQLTADATAALDGYLYPVFRARQVRWFDVSVVIEDDVGIGIWQEAVHEFCQVLRQTGAFRDVRIWRLRYERVHQGQDGGSGQSFPQPETPAGARTSSRFLTGGTRRLTFFLTHGSSPRWLDGSYATLLSSWSRDCSVVLLHLLPRHYWKTTPLGEAAGTCHNDEPGVPTQRLKTQPFWWKLSSELSNPVRLALPCVALDPDDIARWARMQMARGGFCSAVYLSASNASGGADTADTAPTDFERVLSLMKSDSPRAFRLAVYLSAGAFTLPVARLIHESKFGVATQHEDLADVLLSGLFTPVYPSDQPADPNTVYFEVRPDARRLLLRSLSAGDAEYVAATLQDHVSRYVERIYGRTISFRALIPDDDGNYDIPVWAQPFAVLGRSLLGLPPARRDPKSIERLAEPHAVTTALSRSELDQLPRWPNVALAARAARRVQPLFSIAWADAPAEFVREVDQLIRRTEQAAATGSGPGDLEAGKRAAYEAGQHDSIAYNAAAAAVEAAKAVEGDPIVSVQAALRHAQAAATGYAPSAGDVIAGAARRDYEQLLRSLQTDRRKGDRRPAVTAPPALFGNLWPEDTPSPWPTKVPAPEAAASPSTRAGAALAAPDAFVMVLGETDVGHAKTGQQPRRVREIFIPIAARDFAPGFWDWPDGFSAGTAESAGPAEDPSTRGGSRVSTPPSSPALRLTGTIRSFDDSRGFGVISQDGGGDVEFAHYSGIRGLGSHIVGNRVEFELVSDPRGPRAVNVVPLGRPEASAGAADGRGSDVNSPDAALRKADLGVPRNPTAGVLRRELTLLVDRALVQGTLLYSPQRAEFRLLGRLLGSSARAGDILRLSKASEMPRVDYAVGLVVRGSPEYAEAKDHCANSLAESSKEWGYISAPTLSSLTPQNVAETDPVYNFEEAEWYDPPGPVLEYAKYDELGGDKRGDVLLITVTQVELRQVLRLLRPRPKKLRILKVAKGPETYYVGQFGAFDAVVIRCEVGSGGSLSGTAAVRSAIDLWKPAAAVMVGVAFGVDRKKHHPGDVLIAEQITPYEVDWGRANVAVRFATSTSRALLNRFKNALGWHFERPDGTAVKVHSGRILSGDKLIGDPNVKTLLFRLVPEALGGEMEGAGIFAAAAEANIEWVLVKAVCDWGDGRTHEQYQEMAAAAAVSLTAFVLSDENALEGIRPARKKADSRRRDRQDARTLDPEALEAVPIRRTVLALDLADSSKWAATVRSLNARVQRYIDVALRETNLTRRQAVVTTTGDGAILMFDAAADAHRFAERLHTAVAVDNAAVTDPTARWWFRTGAATGDVAIRPRAIADAGRLGTVSPPGHLLVDAATYEALPTELRARYTPAEQVAGKTGESLVAYRCVFAAEADLKESPETSASATRAAGLEQLESLAIRYLHMRRDMRASPKRTSQLDATVEEAVRIAANTGLTATDARWLFESRDPGKRVMGLAILQARPEAAGADLVLSAVKKPRSPFEHYHALRAALGMVGVLGSTDRATLRSAITAKRDAGAFGNAGKRDTARWQLSSELLEVLDRR